MSGKKDLYTFNNFWFKLLTVTKYIYESPKIVFKNAYNYCFNSKKYTEDLTTSIKFHANLLNWRNYGEHYNKELEILGFYNGYIEQIITFTEIQNFNNVYLLAAKETKLAFLQNLKNKQDELNNMQIFFFPEKKEKILCSMKSGIVSLQLSVDIIIQQLKDQEDSFAYKTQEISEIIVEKTTQMQNLMFIERQEHIKELTIELEEKKKQQLSYDTLLETKSTEISDIQKELEKVQLVLIETKAQNARLAHACQRLDKESTDIIAEKNLLANNFEDLKKQLLEQEILLNKNNQLNLDCELLRNERDINIQKLRQSIKDYHQISRDLEELKKNAAFAAQDINQELIILKKELKQTHNKLNDSDILAETLNNNITRLENTRKKNKQEIVFLKDAVTKLSGDRNNTLVLIKDELAGIMKHTTFLEEDYLCDIYQININYKEMSAIRNEIIKLQGERKSFEDVLLFNKELGITHKSNTKDLDSLQNTTYFENQAMLCCKKEVKKSNDLMELTTNTDQLVNNLHKKTQKLSLHIANIKEGYENYLAILSESTSLDTFSVVKDNITSIIQQNSENLIKKQLENTVMFKKTPNIVQDNIKRSVGLEVRRLSAQMSDINKIPNVTPITPVKNKNLLNNETNDVVD